MFRSASPPVLLVLVLATGGCGAGDEDAPPRPEGSASTSTTPSGVTAPSPGEDGAVRKPLTGKVVVLDPGHQRGNRNYGARINAPVDAGGFTKPCNTTGTATNSGYPEATFAWEVARQAQRLLRRLGARVLLTRESNSDDAWGPCIDVRGRVGNPGEPGPAADVRISIHGDGVLASGARGFHVIAPGNRAGWTDDIGRLSRRLAAQVRDELVSAGFVRSTYTGTDGIDVRDDLGTLNHSDVPAVMVELANLRNAEDAELVTSQEGRQRYARALVRAVRAFLNP